MSEHEQTAALRLADNLENLEATGSGGDYFVLTEWSQRRALEAASELRRLDAENKAFMNLLRRAQPAQAGHVPEASCGECGKKTSDGWALYCVACMEKAGLPAQAVPLLSDAEMGEIVNANWGVGVSQMARAIEQAVRAKMGVAVPMTDQISEGKFAPDAKLMELADKIDHEQNWRHSGIFQRDHLTQDQKDRVLAGVMLRRYADLMAPESWRLFPPKSVVSHSYRAATLEAVVKMAERHGIVGKEGA